MLLLFLPYKDLARVHLIFIHLKKLHTTIFISAIQNDINLVHNNFNEIDENVKNALYSGVDNH